MYIPTDPYENITDLRDFDPMQTAIDLTGEEHSRETVGLGMLLAIEKSAQMEYELRKAKDVYGDMPFKEVLAILEEDKWEKLLEEDIPFDEKDQSYIDYCKNVQDKFMIFWKNGILLVLDTFWGQRQLNSMSIYFEVKSHSRRHLFCANGGSIGFIAESDDGALIWDVHSGVNNNGFRTYLAQIQEFGTICETWYKNPKHKKFLSLSHYADKQLSLYNYEFFAQKRIDQFPDHIVKSMGIKKTDWKE